jgi:hypothetical protein
MALVKALEKAYYWAAGVEKSYYLGGWRRLWTRRTTSWASGEGVKTYFHGAT